MCITPLGTTSWSPAEQRMVRREDVTYVGARGVTLHKERTLKSIMVQSGKMFPIIRFLFWHCFRVVWCLPGMMKSDKILGVVLYVCFFFLKWLQILIVCWIFRKAWVWLDWLGRNWNSPRRVEMPLKSISHRGFQWKINNYKENLPIYLITFVEFTFSHSVGLSVSLFISLSFYLCLSLSLSLNLSIFLYLHYYHSLPPSLSIYIYIDR